MAKIDDEIDKIKSHSGNKINVDKHCNLYGWSQRPVENRQATTSNSGPFTSKKNLSGAAYDNRWQQGTSSNDQKTPDRWYPDYSKIKAGIASDTFDINSIADNSGFTVYNQNNSPIAYVRFVNGPLYSEADTNNAVGYCWGDDGIVNVSIDYLKKNPSRTLGFSAGIGDFYGSTSISVSSNNVTVSISPGGSIYEGANTETDKKKDSGFASADNINKYSVSNGISADSGSTSNTDVRVRPLRFEKQASDATFDLTDYQTNDSSTLEKFIGELAGKAIKDNSYGSGYNNVESSYTNSTNGWYYEFIDSASDDPSINRSKIYSDYATTIDLNQLRRNVETGQTIADAFAELMTNFTRYTVYRNNEYQQVVTKNYNVDGDETSGVRSITLQQYQPISDADTTMTAVEGELRHYDLDFNKWFDTENAQQLAEYDLISQYIDGKGIRTFCATDNTEWFNFIFRDGKENFADESFDAGPNIHTIQIDVSGVKTAEELVQAIYDQSEPELKKINHYFHMKIDKPSVLRIYDDRAYTNYYFRNTSSYREFQKGDGTDMNDEPVIGAQTTNGGGAKIADGIIEKDDVRVVIEKNLSFYEKRMPRTFVRELQIQDTTKSSMNIRLRIPQMTLNNIFYPLPDKSKQHVQDYDVVLKANRDALLSAPKADPPVKGIIDRGMDYLLEANTLIGAQLARLEFTETNIGKTLENTQAAESTIRDADMAKAMTDYTKQNILMQASQSMLAQANQNLSGVLSLLQ